MSFFRFTVSWWCQKHHSGPHICLLWLQRHRDRCHRAERGGFSSGWLWLWGGWVHTCLDKTMIETWLKTMQKEMVGLHLFYIKDKLFVVQCIVQKSWICWIGGGGVLLSTTVYIYIYFFFESPKKPPFGEHPPFLPIKEMARVGEIAYVGLSSSLRNRCLEWWCHPLGCPRKLGSKVIGSVGFFSPQYTNYL